MLRVYMPNLCLNVIIDYCQPSKKMSKVTNFRACAYISKHSSFGLSITYGTSAILTNLWQSFYFSNLYTALALSATAIMSDPILPEKIYRQLVCMISKEIV